MEAEPVTGVHFESRHELLADELLVLVAEAEEGVITAVALLVFVDPGDAGKAPASTVEPEVQRSSFDHADDDDNQSHSKDDRHGHDCFQRRTD